MRTKPGVLISLLRPEVADLLPRIEAAFRAALETSSQQEMLITSGHEGYPGDKVHSRYSLHYLENCPDNMGLAVDISVLDFLRFIQEMVAQAVGAGWDVVLEYPQKCPGCKRSLVTPHLHVERDPKKKPLDPPGSFASGGATG